jgi:hypothetical protein
MSKKSFSNRACRTATLGLLGLSAAGLLASCNSHPVSFAQSEGAVAIVQDRSPDSAEAVDILWVIDNSGSMCQEQKAIRDNFTTFIDQIASQNIDFQIGVTTTDMSDNIDMVARPGYLQAMPQPVPGFTKGCSGDEDGPGEVNDEDFVDDDDPMNGYQPVRANIELAVSCTKNPEQWAHLLEVTDDEIGCALSFDISGPGDGENNDGCPDDATRYGIFPTTPTGQRPIYGTPPEESPYRQLGGGDMVLSASEYRNQETGQLDIEALKADFACMSLVGTGGSALEKGLAASVRAVSPKMTGGTVENPIEKGVDAPNHGLLREDANFALIFVTDENDCSDYGLFAGETAAPQAIAFTDEDGNPIESAVDNRTECGASVCAMWTNPALAESTPLIKTKLLADRLMANLAASKGVDAVNENAVVVTSIHGNYLQYGASYPTQSAIDEAISKQPEADQQTIREKIETMLANPNECTGRIRQAPYSAVDEKRACASPTLGTAFSGDRYESFLEKFPADRVLPAIPEDENAHMPGLICEGEDGIRVTLGKIGELIAGSVAQCIESPPHACNTDADCPAFGFGGEAGSCLQFGTGTQKYCDSGLQVRLYPGEGEDGHTFAELQNHEYCIPESIDSMWTPGGCVIDRQWYDMIPCASTTDAINLDWTAENPHEDLAGYKVELVYTLLPEGSDDGTTPAANNADVAP